MAQPCCLSRRRQFCLRSSLIRVLEQLTSRGLGEGARLPCRVGVDASLRRLVGPPLSRSAGAALEDGDRTSLGEPNPSRCWRQRFVSCAQRNRDRRRALDIRARLRFLCVVVSPFAARGD
ncbi:hypothetical protein MTO96_009695 [Rhipicephalus appendiculatus]